MGFVELNISGAVKYRGEKIPSGNEQQRTPEPCPSRAAMPLQQGTQPPTVLSTETLCASLPRSPERANPFTDTGAAYHSQ